MAYRNDRNQNGCETFVSQPFYKKTGQIDILKTNRIQIYALPKLQNNLLRLICWIDGQLLTKNRQEYRVFLHN